MNGTVTVFCKKHGVKCFLRDGKPWHESWGVTGYCESKTFTVRRERVVRLAGALHELELTERSRGRG